MRSQPKILHYANIEDEAADLQGSWSLLTGEPSPPLRRRCWCQHERHDSGSRAQKDSSKEPNKEPTEPDFERRPPTVSDNLRR